MKYKNLEERGSLKQNLRNLKTDVKLTAGSCNNNQVTGCPVFRRWDRLGPPSELVIPVLRVDIINHWPLPRKINNIIILKCQHES